jgi:hypothetical protein
MTKEIGAFFDSIDGAKKAHEKKKKSIFASANEEALETWMKRTQAADAEAELRTLIVNSRGLSAWQELLKIRRDIANERRERERQLERERIEFRETVEVMVIIGFIFFLFIAGAFVALVQAGYVDPWRWKWLQF